MLRVKLRKPRVLDLPWLALVDEEWGQRCHVLADARQEGNPGSIAILGCTKQFALLFDTKGKYSLRSIDYSQKKSFLVHVIRVARLDVVFLDFRANLSSSAAKQTPCTSTYKLKVSSISRRIIGFLSCNV